MPITPYNIARHELIGLQAKVVKSTNPSNVGIRGKIVDETHHTLVIEQDGSDKKVFKRAITLLVELPNKQKVEIEGKILEGKPWERIKRKKAR